MAGQADGKLLAAEPAITLDGMEPLQRSPDLLSHFDGDARAGDVVDRGGATATAVRGVGWVLKWAAAAAVFVYSTTVLTEFAYSLAAERMLVRAARAGALEATLPRATFRSVEQSVWRRLPEQVASRGEVKLALFQNGAGIIKKMRLAGGDRVTVALTVPAQALMPDWMRMVTSWRGFTKVTARAERILPGRQLPRTSS